MSSNHLFFSMLKNPKLTGAVAPSSKYLAQTMCHRAKGATRIIELGAGTGAVTKTLLDLYPNTPLVAVEYQSELADKLKQRFPQVQVEQKTAKEVLDQVTGETQNCAIISSLPFRSLPKQVHDETVESIIEFFKRCQNTKLIQFTYWRIAPFDLPAGFEWEFVGKVWRNLPPATVWELSYTPNT